jgi:hypothetical protein
MTGIVPKRAPQSQFLSIRSDFNQIDELLLLGGMTRMPKPERFS